MDNWQIAKGERGFRINFLLHAAGMVERAALQQPLSASEEDKQELLNDVDYESLHIQVLSLSRVLDLTFPIAEEVYLFALINHQIDG